MSVGVTTISKALRRVFNEAAALPSAPCSRRRRTPSRCHSNSTVSPLWPQTSKQFAKGLLNSATRRTPKNLRPVYPTLSTMRARADVHQSFAGVDDVMHLDIQSWRLDEHDVAGAMAAANYDGIDEVYIETETDIDIDRAVISIDEPTVLQLDGRIALGIGTERPYTGHMFEVHGNDHLERCGRRCFDRADLEVRHAALNDGWLGDGVAESVGPISTPTLPGSWQLNST